MYTVRKKRRASFILLVFLLFAQLSPGGQVSTTEAGKLTGEAARIGTTKEAEGFMSVMSAMSALSLFDAQSSQWSVVDLTEIEIPGGKTQGQMLVEALVGSGVVVKNVKYTGVNSSAGLFQTADNIIGFKEGIILSTGSVHNVPGPNTSDSITTHNGLTGDTDLRNIIGRATYDATVLEFEFIPTNDEIFFEYVFASDEYNEYVNTNYNDVFAFIVNGVNAARIPGTDIPVSINTVNGGKPLGSYASFPQFYLNNDLSDGGGNINTEMDGLTVVLPIRVKVVPGQYNRIKMAIADVGDSSYDSNVFIRAGSFSGHASKISGIIAASNIKVQKTNYPQNTVGVPVNDPIDTATGAQVLKETLLQVSGAIPLSFEVIYNSLLLDEGVMGAGWTHTYEVCLKEYASDLVVIYWDSNRKNTFVDLGNGQFVSPDKAMRYDKLTKNPDGSYSLVTRSKVEYIFDSQGNIRQIHNGKGQYLELTHNDNGLLASVAEPISDKALYFQYDQNKLLSVSDGADREVMFTYGENGLLSQITDVTGEKFYYFYNLAGQITTATDSNGVQLFENTFDELGRVIAQKDPKGFQGTFTYDEETEPDFLVTTYTNREGSQLTFKYNKLYQLVAHVDELGYTEQYSYNEEGERSSITARNGSISLLFYDERGNMTKVVDSLGREAILTYDSNDNLTSFINAAGNSIAYTYNSQNKLTAVTEPSGNKYTFAYNEYGQLTEFTMPSGSKTIYEYEGGMLSKLTNSLGEKRYYQFDTAGRVEKISDDLGTILRFGYNKANMLTLVEDVENNSYVFTYDYLGNVLSVTDANKNETRFVYDPNGNLIKMIDPLDNETTYAYSVENRLTKLTNAKGKFAAFHYDPKGRITAVTNPLGHTKFIEYDEMDNVVSRDDALGNTILSATYDVVNNPVLISDSLGNSVSLKYDILDRLQEYTDPLGNTTQFIYDELNRLVSSVDALGGQAYKIFDQDDNIAGLTDVNNNQSQFVYDSVGRIISKVDASLNKKLFSYTQRGQLAKIINSRSQATSIEYDQAGRISKIIEGDKATTYEYDSNGNVLIITDGTGAIIREYDSLGRVTSYTDNRGHQIKYQYDELGNLVVLTYPDNKIVIYTYDDANRLTKVTDWAARETVYQYDANGRLIQVTRPNGTVLTRNHNSAGQLIEQKDVDKNGKIISHFIYTFNANGNIISEVTASEKLVPVKTEIKMTYSLDNRLATFMGMQVKFDTDGNMVYGPLSEQFETYEYDSRNRLTRAGSTQYIYDAENNRIAVKEKGVTTNYIVNTNSAVSHVLAEETSDSYKYYIYGHGLVGHEDNNGNYLSYHFDLRGSTIALTNQSGKIVKEYQYDPYGRLLTENNTQETPYLYAGQYGITTDQNGLYYIRARYYNAEIRRFINEDIQLGALINSKSLNRYAYVQGNPITYIDVDGEIPVPVITAGIGALVSVTSRYVGDVAENVADHGWSLDSFKPKSSLKEYGSSAIAGATGGFLVGIGGGGFAVTVAGGAVTGGTETTIDEFWHYGKNLNEVSGNAIAKNFIVGGVTSGISYGVGKVVAKVAPSLYPKTFKTPFEQFYKGVGSNLFENTPEYGVQLFGGMSKYLKKK